MAHEFHTKRSMANLTPRCMINLIIVFVFLLAAVSPTYQMQHLGSKLTAQDIDKPWLSPSNEFAFGFYSLPKNSSLFLLSIWFYKISERTVVWSANGDNPVQAGSKVELNKSGYLVLYDHKGAEIWRANSAPNLASSASLLDTGNLQLFGQESSSPIWESFNMPTDTMLPNQTLQMASKLTSRISETDFAKGRFELQMQEDGNLVLYSVSLAGEVVYEPYFATNAMALGSKLVFNDSGFVFQSESNGTLISLLSPKDLTSAYTYQIQLDGSTSFAPGNLSNQDFYHRMTLDVDGVLRQYMHPKTSADQVQDPSWSVVMYKPDDVCLKLLSVRGGGVCSYNGYCKFDDIRKTTSCLCPPEYGYLDPSNQYAGCTKVFPPQSCELGGAADAARFDLRVLINVDWPLNDYEWYYPVNEWQCRRECLNDCFCDVAVFIDGNCWKKKMPLTNGKMDTSVNRKTFIKVPKTNDSSVPTDQSQSCRKKDRTPVIIALSGLLGGSGLLNILMLSAISLLLLFAYRQRKKLRVQRGYSGMSGIKIRSFAYTELVQATRGFEEELERGAFGAVYRGTLSVDSRQHAVAVKMLEKTAEEESYKKEFETEVMAIGQTHHRNLARLLGFCSEGQKRLLVYELLASGSLATFLFGCVRPDWNQRVQIAVGIARGLLYLHEECETQIIHCDINPYNIMLDECFTPRIFGFGLAKLMKAEQSRSTTGVRGTRGYVAPEWFRNTPITAKVDVYSFGVLLLEIICCRRNLEAGLEDEDMAVLMDWAHNCCAGGRVDLLVENDGEAMSDMRKVERMVMVGVWCLEGEPASRPSMAMVVDMLEGVVEVCRPPHSVLHSSFTTSVP